MNDHTLFEAEIEEAVLIAYSRLCIVREALAAHRWTSAHDEAARLGEQGAQLLLAEDLADALAQREVSR
jgi:hypothetical protein